MPREECGPAVAGGGLTKDDAHETQVESCGGGSVGRDDELPPRLRPGKDDRREICPSCIQGRRVSRGPGTEDEEAGMTWRHDFFGCGKRVESRLSHCRKGPMSLKLRGYLRIAP